ncbi:hypothetical protein MRX96_057247 [Rhipicephalus microplus]
MMSKPTAGKPGGLVFNDCARTAQPKGNFIKWRQRDTPMKSADDIIVVLKPHETLHLKRAFQTGDLGAAIAQYVGGEAAAILNVWPVWTKNLIVCGTQHVEAAITLARTLDSGDESASLCSRMGLVTYGPLISTLESRMSALEKNVAHQMAPLPTMIAEIIQAQMQQPVTTLTQQITAAVTHNVKAWIQVSPELFRRASPVKEVGRPPRVYRNIEEESTEDISLVPAFKAVESQPASNSANRGAGT